jgi:hypothetical protein
MGSHLKLPYISPTAGVISKVALKRYVEHIDFSSKAGGNHMELPYISPTALGNSKAILKV